MNCLRCNTETTNPKFCSKSCAAAWNNSHSTKRPKAARKPCIVCGKPVKQAVAAYCSKACSSSRLIKPQEHHQAMNALRQSRYRAKKYRTMASDADHEKIKQIYLNCPAGHEVDHIIPVSRGGLHHEDNLQYLPILANRRKGNRLVQEAGIEPTRPFGKAL